MRLKDVNTTDVVCSKDGYPFRIIQLGPTRGGTLWTTINTFRNMSGKFNYDPTLRRDQRTSSVFGSGIGHLGVRGHRLHDVSHLESLEIPDFATLDSSQYTETAIAFHERIERRNDDLTCGTRLTVCIADTRSLMSLDDYKSKREAASKKRQEEQDKFAADLAAYQELFDQVAPMLAESGMSDADIDRQRRWNRTYGAGSGAEVKVPLNVLININNERKN